MTADRDADRPQQPDRDRQAAETLKLDALKQESAQLEVSVEDLTAFSILYYRAGIDSGRVARRTSTRWPSVDVGSSPWQTTSARSG